MNVNMTYFMQYDLYILFGVIFVSAHNVPWIQVIQVHDKKLLLFKDMWKNLKTTTAYLSPTFHTLVCG